MTKISAIFISIVVALVTLVFLSFISVTSGFEGTFAKLIMAALSLGVGKYTYSSLEKNK